MHRDGVDYVLVLLVRRHNIDSGTTHDRQRCARLLRQLHPVRSLRRRRWSTTTASSTA
jgi:hypothetical protein